MVRALGAIWAKLCALPTSDRARSALVAVGAPMLSAIVCIESLAKPVPSDFLSFYYAGRAVAAGANPYVASTLGELAKADGVTTLVYPYLYSPFLAEVLSLFSRLPLARVYTAWLELSIASTAVIGVFACAVHRLCLRGGATLIPSLTTAICILVLPVANNVALGQVNLIVMAFTLLAIVNYLSGRPALAGVLLAPAVLVKGTPLVILGFFLARRSFRALYGFGATVLLLIGVSALIGGLSPWLDYVRALPQFSYGKDIPDLFPIGTVYNFSPAGHLVRTAATERTLVAVLALALAGAAFAGAFACALFARNRREEALALALFFPAMIVAGPLAYVHHVVYLVPAALIWLTWSFTGARAVVFFSVIFALALCGTDWPVLYDDLGRLFARRASQSLNLYALGLLDGFGLLAYALARRLGREA